MTTSSASFDTSSGGAFSFGSPPTQFSGSGTATGGSGDSVMAKFRTSVPPSLAVSPLASPSSMLAIPPGLSPAALLDSPAFMNSLTFPSPTTGMILEALNWRPDATADYTDRGGSVSGDPELSFPDFSFQVAAPSQAVQSLVSLPTQPGAVRAPSGASTGYALPAQSGRRKSDDGYHWRKYGQKQVKGSENPRSYYKCTHPSCPTKKKVERSLDGRITEIIYKGTHNHLKPQGGRRSGGGAAFQPLGSTGLASEASEHSVIVAAHSGTPGATPENSSASFGDDEISMSSPRAPAFADKGDENDPCLTESSWRNESGSGSGNGDGGALPGSRAVKEPRVVVQTMSDIDILDDGYRWRKYGQKVVKGNQNPRSYYKCTSAGCPVRKHVERASHDHRSVITTYEGKHNHDVPIVRGSAGLYRPVSQNSSIISNNMQPTATIFNYPNQISTTSQFGSSQHNAFRFGMSQPPQELERLINFNSSFAHINQPQHHRTDSEFQAKEELSDEHLFDDFFPRNLT